MQCLLGHIEHHFGPFIDRLQSVANDWIHFGFFVIFVNMFDHFLAAYVDYFAKQHAAIYYHFSHFVTHFAYFPLVLGYACLDVHFLVLIQSILVGQVRVVVQNLFEYVDLFIVYARYYGIVTVLLKVADYVHFYCLLIVRYYQNMSGCRKYALKLVLDPFQH